MNTPNNRGQNQRGGSSGKPNPYTSTPDHYQQADHSFTLQAIMEMHKTLGSLCEKSDALNKQLDGMDNRLSSVEQTVSGMSHKMYAGGILLLIALAVGGFIIDKAWDLVVDQIKPKVEEPAKK